MPNSDLDRFSRGDAEHRLTGLRSFYVSGKDVTVTALPNGTANVVAEVASGRSVIARVHEGARFDGLEPGTYSVRASDAMGHLLAEEFTTVAAHPGERPVHGFATSFSDGGITSNVCVRLWIGAMTRSM